MKNKTFVRMCFIALGLLLASTTWAGKNHPFGDPNQGGYGFQNDGASWFDGKDYPFFTDMFDGFSIKPQEEGTYQNFPKDSVPVKMNLGKIEKIYDPFIPAGPERDQKPANPVQATPESIEKGRFLYNTYCAVCHGKDGNAGTMVTQKGMPAPPIVGFLAAFPPSHFYNKIKYGSFYQEPRGMMPAYGAQTSVADRWNIVNYLTSPQFGKEAK